MAGHLIDSTEMYLRTVLELEEEAIPAIRARLAERLELSAPTVSEGVSRLEAEGLLKLTNDRTLELTPEGRELASRVMRKHRLAERLLVDIIGLEQEHVHEEACRWEHVISDNVEEKLVELLGNPETSPYGNPIPGTGARDREVTPLADLDEGEVRLLRISEKLQSDHEVMRALHEAGISAGATVAVRREDDEVIIEQQDTEVRLSRDAAQLIYVDEI